MRNHTLALALVLAVPFSPLGCGADLSAGDDAVAQQDQAIIFPSHQLAPPRLLAPLSTAAVTSLATPLRWHLGPNEHGALVQICHDRACRAIEFLHPVLGGALRSLPPLAPGVHFWRVYGFRGLLRSASPSATWEFRVGPRPSGAVRSSFGHAADYNGDGYADLAIPATEVGGPADRVYVYHGSPRGLRARPDRVLAGVPGVPRALEWGATSFDLDAGDLNGDGYSDMVVRAREAAFLPAQVYVYYGGPAGLPAAPSEVLPAVTTPGYEHGYAFGAAGDLEGDGYGDLAVGDISVPERFDDNAGFVHIYRGGAGGVAATPDLTLTEGVREVLVGWALAGSGNFDADAFSDLLVTAPMRSFAPGRFKVFPGSATGLTLSTMTTVQNPDPRGGSKMGDATTMAGDVNGDGYCDVVVSQEGQSLPGRRNLVYFGSAAGLSTAVGQTLITDPSGSHFGRGLAGGGDVNGDGYSDLAASLDTGEVQLYLGGPGGYAVPPAATIAALPRPDANARALSITHDFNRDGYADLYTRGGVFLGRASGLPDVASVALAGP